MPSRREVDRAIRFQFPTEPGDVFDIIRQCDTFLLSCGMMNPSTACRMLFELITRTIRERMAGAAGHTLVVSVEPMIDGIFRINVQDVDENGHCVQLNVYTSPTNHADPDPRRAGSGSLDLYAAQAHCSGRTEPSDANYSQQ